jgi:signal transduction histidine kinase
VLTTPRRITLYWLLLLVPTLAVGVGALVLLHREQTRLRESTTAVADVARAAVEARAVIVAENAALLVTEVQRSLLDGLGELPVTGLDAALSRFEEAHPYARTTFLCRPDGTLLRPAGAEYERRFSLLLTSQRPWNVDESKDEVERAEQDETLSTAQKRVFSNRTQRQSVEEEVRKVAEASQSRLYAGREAPAPAASALPKPSSSSPLADAGEPMARPARSGWVPWYADNALFVLGWFQPGGAGVVRGVELDLPALVARLGAVLPADLGAGERYAIRDDRGNTLHSVGTAGDETDQMPVVRLEFAAALPNWEVVAWSVPAYEAGPSAGGWFLLGALLVGVFVIAILSGGLLLLTQARRSEAEAAQKTSFVANVSHEFKTPLTTIRLYAELLAQGRVSEGSRRTEYLETIGRETQRLARLVGNVLDFSRLEQGRKKYQPEPLDAGEVVRALLAAHTPRLAEAGLRLETELPSSPLTVTTDRDALEQIVLNLLDNACKYAAAGGEVSVSVKPRASGGATIEVSDRGPGVPPAHAERIFEKFHRVDDTLTSGHAGAGLGLGIARQLARGLRGDVRYRPRAGGGATFILTLP